MEVILLERVAKLGQMGDTVRVRDGFARNFLLPRGKALRATEGQQGALRERSAPSSRPAISSARKEAEAVGDKLDGQSFVDRPPGRRDRRALRLGLDPRPRRDAHQGGFTVGRDQIVLNPPIKTLGLHNVPVSLHPEVEVQVTINVARSPEEAERQARGETVTTREETNLDDLGLEVGAALADAGDTREG